MLYFCTPLGQQVWLKVWVLFFIYLVIFLLLTDFVCLLHHRDFLPRGSGIVTRRPLVLQLINSPTGELVATATTLSSVSQVIGEQTHLNADLYRISYSRNHILYKSVG